MEPLEDEESSAVFVPTEETSNIPIQGDVFVEDLDEDKNPVSDSSADDKGMPKLLILISGLASDGTNVWCQIVPLGKVQVSDGQEYHYPGPLTFEVYEKDEWDQIGSLKVNELVFDDDWLSVYIKIDKNKYKGQELQLVIKDTTGQIIETKPVGYEEPVETEIRSAAFDSRKNVLTVKITPKGTIGDEYVISDALWCQVYDNTQCDPKNLIYCSDYFSPKINKGSYTFTVPVDPSKFGKKEKGTVALYSLLKGKEISRMNFIT